MGQRRNLSPEDRKLTAELLRRRGRADRGWRKPPRLPADDPQRRVSAEWETLDEVRRIEQIIAAATQGDATALAALRKFVQSYPSTPGDPARRALAQIEREGRRKGALATAEKKLAKYADPQVVRDAVAHVDRFLPGLSPRKRSEAIRSGLGKAAYPEKKNFSRWLKAILKK